MRFEIREATPDDAKDIVSLINRGIDEGAFHNRTVSVDGYLEFAFDNQKKGFKLFVCQIDNDIVGYMDSQMGKYGVGEILGVYVETAHRRLGLGRRLMERTLDQFIMNDCHKARLWVFADNKGAIGFYKKIGFVQEGYLQEDEERRDTIIFSIFLE